MRGFFILSALTALSVPAAALAGNEGGEIHDRIDSVVVSASRAGDSTPVTFTMVGKDRLRGTSPRNSLPMAISFQPSVVVTNEGGTGLGYSKMTVRGSKGSQINVTLNGITLNDSESQEVFWVNIPALTSILSSVQIQRGLGTTSCGSGAFGASVNMNTAFIGTAPTATVDFSRGSYNTALTTVTAGTGITPSGLYASAAYSKGTTDGYIRNAWADVESAFTVIGYLKGANSLRLTWLMGDQHTGITWNGISLAQYRTDRRANTSGAYKDADDNTRYYPNESDNYTQHHLQLNYTRQLTSSLAWSTTLNYTRGDGYYEQYKTKKKFSKYGIDHASKSDFITRKLMGNDYTVLNTEVKYGRGALDLTAGAQYSCYYGTHYGDILWSSVLGDSHDYSAYGASDNTNPWYFNDGDKRELNYFARAEYRALPWLNAYADLQYRRILYKLSGVDDDEDMPMDYNTVWNFFNPRAGLTAALSVSQSLYASVAVGHREPGRSDIKETIGSNIIEGASRTVRPERMVDIEAGYRYTGENISLSANIYMMEYQDMLLETGKLTQSGHAIKENVGKSYRRGIELAGAWTVTPAITLEANTTFSTNKIQDHTQYYTTYDNDDDWNVIFPQYSEHLGKVTMLMSPSNTTKGRIILTPLERTTIILEGQYVSKQYWDNTQCEDRTVPAYFVSDLSVSREFKVRGGVLGLSGYVNNLFNRKYYADVQGARSYVRSVEGFVQEEGVFPQAPVNVMFKLSFRY